MRSLSPIPAVTFPKPPFLNSSFSSKFMVFSFLPSSIPVAFACSVLSLNTCTFLIASADKFLVAILVSPPKNCLPSTVTRFTSCPWALIFPSWSTDMPGSFLSKSSTVEPGGTLNDAALYSTVSPLILSGALAVRTTTS